MLNIVSYARGKNENEANRTNLLAKNGAWNHRRSIKRRTVKIPGNHKQHGRNKHPALLNLVSTAYLPHIIQTA